MTENDPLGLMSSGDDEWKARSASFRNTDTDRMQGRMDVLHQELSEEKDPVLKKVLQREIDNTHKTYGVSKTPTKVAYTEGGPPVDTGTPSDDNDPLGLLGSDPLGLSSSQDKGILDHIKDYFSDSHNFDGHNMDDLVGYANKHSESEGNGHILGAAEALSNMTTGFGGAIAGGLTKLGTLPFVGLEGANTIGDDVADRFTDKPVTEQGKKTSEFINKKFGQGVQYVKDKNLVGGALDLLPGKIDPKLSSTLNDATVDLAAYALPMAIPHVMGRFGKGKAKVDSRVAADIQMKSMQEQINKAAKEAHKAPEGTAAHADDFAAINPYDQGGHVTALQEGMPTRLDDPQGNLFGGLEEGSQGTPPIEDTMSDSLLNDQHKENSVPYQMSLADDIGHDGGVRNTDPMTGKPVQGMDASVPTTDFPLKTEVLDKDTVVHDMRQQIANHEAQIKELNDTGYPKAAIDAQHTLEMTKDAFAERLDKDYGIKKGSDAYTALFESGNGTRLPIEHTFNTPMSKFGRQKGSIDPSVFVEGLKKIGDFVKGQKQVEGMTDKGIPQFLAKRATDRQDAKVAYDTMVNEKPMNALKGISPISKALSDLVPEQRPIPEIIKDIVDRKLPDVEPNIFQKAASLFTSGALWESLKHPENPVIKKTYEVMVAARSAGQNKINTFVKDPVTGMLPKYRDMSLDEKVAFVNMNILADAHQFEITPKVMEEAGWSKKQIEAQMTRKVALAEALKSINEARAVQGKKPVDPRIGYALSQMDGDFRKPVFIEKTDGTREFIGQIGSDYRISLNKIEAKLKEAHPEWIIGEEHYLGKGAHRDANGTRQSAYRAAMQLLVDNNPHTENLVKVLHDNIVGDAYDYMNAKKHTLAKKGTFGSEGREMWKSSEENALKFMKAEVLYTETMFKWSELSKGVEELAPLLSAKEVNMPNAKAWAEAYIDKAMGINPTMLGKGFDNILAAVSQHTGIGSSVITGTGLGTKSLTNKTLLALNPMFLAANILQPMTGMPKLKALMNARGVTGLNFDGGTGYRYLGEAAATMLKSSEKKSTFEKAIDHYGHEHSLFGNEILDHSSQIHKGKAYYASKVTDFGINGVESSTNQAVFIAVSHMLKDGGMRVGDGLFETAQKMTKMVMHDYSPMEASPIFQHLGPVGMLSKNLTKYKMGEASQLAFFAREIPTKGDARPLAVHTAVTIAYAGIFGMMGFSLADQAYQMLTKRLGKPDTLTRLLMDNAPTIMTHGALGHALGVDLTKRMGSPDFIPSSLGEAAFPGGSKAYDAAAAVGHAAMNPTEMNAKRALRELSPNIINGTLDRTWFATHDAKGNELGVSRKLSDKHDLQGQVPRTDGDKIWKTLGAQGEHESIEKLKKFNNDTISGNYADLRKSVLAKLDDAYFANGNKFNMKDLAEARKKFIALQGDPNEFAAKTNKMAMDLKTSAKQRDLMGAGNSVNGAYKLKRMFNK